MFRWRFEIPPSPPHHSKLAVLSDFIVSVFVANPLAEEFNFGECCWLQRRYDLATLRRHWPCPNEQPVCRAAPPTAAAVPALQPAQSQQHLRHETAAPTDCRASTHQPALHSAADWHSHAVEHSAAAAGLVGGHSTAAPVAHHCWPARLALSHHGLVTRFGRCSRCTIRSPHQHLVLLRQQFDRRPFGSASPR